jgi:hypothetical protein
MTILPRILVTCVVAGGACLPSIDGAAADPAPPQTPLTWHDVSAGQVEGRLWTDEERLRPFDRFPAAAEAMVPKPVWNLSRESAGMMVRFRTDATALHVRMTLRSDVLDKPHMPASGMSGVDLYARDANDRWRWVAAIKPEKQSLELPLLAGLVPGTREYALWLPLFNGVESLAVGVPESSAFTWLDPRDKPIVFYGTSITHGACASRPGMAHVAILGRRLDRPVANLGFSGNGRMDPGVGDLLARVDAACYVIDCLPNMNAELVRERCIPLVKRLRGARPDTPIILVEDRLFTNAWITAGKEAFHDANHAALKEAFDTLRREGVQGLWYIPGDTLLGDDSDATVDGSHPTDLGFVRQADAFETVLRAALGMPK